MVSDSAYFGFFERSNNEIYVFDPESLKFDMVNAKARENLGYQMKELSEKTPLDLKPSFKEEDFRSVLQPLLHRSVSNITFQTQHLRKNKSLYDVDVKVEYFRTPKGLRIVAFIKDITERLQSKKQLEAQELFNQNIINNIPDIITRFDRQYRIIFISPSVATHTDQPLGFFIGKRQRDLGNDKDQVALFEENIQKVFDQKTGAKFHSTVDSPNGILHYSNYMVPEFNKQGEVDSVLLISRDISETKQLEMELQEKVNTLQAISKELGIQNRFLQEFANIASHNLRSPAGNIQALLSLMEEEEDPKEHQLLFERLKETAEGLKFTIDELTEIVNMSRPKEEQEQEPLHVETIFRRLLRSLSVQVEEKHAQIITDFAQCPKITFHKVYFESVLLNLLTNSLKYSAENRPPIIKVKTYWEQECPVLTFEDNGIGIDLEQHGDQLFGLHKTFHKHPDARGVGLFISKNQIENLGGSIAVESQVNVGTKFTLTFAPVTD